tara:strand:+ start:68 stop:268 length:201 start_codon:yes stop_codon:yes gene_type:complete
MKSYCGILTMSYNSLMMVKRSLSQTKLWSKKMNEKAERINGWAAMVGVIAAMGSYAATGQIIPGVW